jgi:hypothetical protein
MDQTYCSQPVNGADGVAFKRRFRLSSVDQCDSNAVTLEIRG